MIRLVTVGTGTVSPSATRSSPAHWVEVRGGEGRGGVEKDGEGREGIPSPSFPIPLHPSPPVRLLMDCGAGTIHGLARFGLPWLEITHIVITHFHTDHIGE